MRTQVFLTGTQIQILVPTLSQIESNTNNSKLDWP